MTSSGNWYHCAVKVISRAAGRSVVAAAAYRLGERLHDERYAEVHDYRRKGGVLDAFTLAPAGSPEWALDPERLWNAAEKSEVRKNSCLAREVELALPAFLSQGDRLRITERFAGELVERYGVAVSAAIHAPARGDDRNFHAHILFTTRELGAEGFGKKTRVLDDAKTGRVEVTRLRELAAECINDALADANSDERVDHRSFKDRGVVREPTTHLGPAASEMERRGERSDRGDLNRDAADQNARTDQSLGELEALDRAITSERRAAFEPPSTVASARERVADTVAPFVQAIQTRGHIADSQRDGLSWWQRAASKLATLAWSFALDLGDKAKRLWSERGPDLSSGRDRDNGEREGLDR